MHSKEVKRLTKYSLEKTDLEKKRPAPRKYSHTLRERTGFKRRGAFRMKRGCRPEEVRF